MSKYRVVVSVPSIKLITIEVNDFKIVEDGKFLKLYDPKFGCYKYIPMNCVQIEEL